MRLSKTIDSPRLILETLEADAAKGPYFNWMNDASVTRFLVEARHARPSSDDLRAYIDAALRSENTFLLGIVLRDGRRHIGNLKLGPIDWRNLRTELGLMLGDTDYRGIGLGREAIGAATRFAFEELDLHKVTAGYMEPNAASGRAFAAVGYVEEARLAEHFLFEGRWVADVRLACFKPRG
jgi:[ribosomal protein S5]-alanine N-acetyltransferase